jgi:hypothetical protein
MSDGNIFCFLYIVHHIKPMFESAKFIFPFVQHSKRQRISSGGIKSQLIPYDACSTRQAQVK